jgi:hypothetical protein
LRDGHARAARGHHDRRSREPAAIKRKEHLVDRKKPSLTSPGKVGLLVALLIVVTALGVSYFITGTFGVSWHWIRTAGLSPATWTFNFGAFVEEMAPLLVLTSLLSFGAYVLVAGAVRRYKAYVDSGVEYRQLLKSIKSLEDLEDEGVTDRLKQHPELREFLLGVKHRLTLHERVHGERGERRASHANASAADEGRALASECATLAGAIAAGPDEFPAELALTVPELRQIERAVRAHFARAVAAPVADAPDDGELEALREAVRAAVTVMRRDVGACAEGARELETTLAALCQELQFHARPAAANAAGAEGVRKRVDTTAEALAALGEETKRIAIAAALQASGGPDADAIKVADELRTLATRFNSVAQHWRQTAPELKALLGASNARGGSSPSGAAEAATTAVARARLWSERTVAVREHVRALERAVQTNGRKPAEASPPVAPAPSRFDSSEKPMAAPSPAAPAADSSDDFIAQGAAHMFGSDHDRDVSFADIPGFEKERRFFADETEQPVEPDDRFVVDGANEGWSLSGESGAEEASGSEPASCAPAPGDTDGFLTGPRPVVSPRKIERPEPSPAPRSAAPEPHAAEPAATATMDPDADAVDLYELGAVDCVQTA